MKNEDVKRSAEQMVKDLRDIANCLLEATGTTKEELESQLHDSNHYSPEYMEFIRDYKTKIKLRMQQAGDAADHENLKKEEDRAKMHLWIHVK